MTVDEMTVDEMTVDEMIVDIMTWYGIFCSILKWKKTRWNCIIPGGG